MTVKMRCCNLDPAEVRNDVVVRDAAAAGRQVRRN